MTTLERLAKINVTINFELPIECLTISDFPSMSHDELMGLWNKIGKLMDLGEATYEQRILYWDIDRYENDRYYYENIDAFRVYEQSKGRPDFDWNFYSDWHKDLFGFRPR